MEIITIIQVILQIIGVATIALNIFAPLTKNKTDDKIVAFLKRILEIVSLNMVDNKLIINLKRR